MAKPTFQRRHYITIAALFAKIFSNPQMQMFSGSGDVADLARHMADTFAADNPRFDRAKFLAACKVQS